MTDLKKEKIKIEIYLDLTKSNFKFKNKPKAIILDDNELSIASYFEEHPNIVKELDNKNVKP
jgi:hypothetical protein